MTDYKNNGYIVVNKHLQTAFNQHDRIYDDCDEVELEMTSNLNKQYFDSEGEFYLYPADKFAAYFRALKDAYSVSGRAPAQYDALLEELAKQGIKVPSYGSMTCPADLRVESI